MLTGVVLFVTGLFALFAVRHLLRKILALQVMSAGVFMVLVALGHFRPAGEGATSGDPVPHALVLTGIVVSISATAMALALTCRYHEESGRSTFPEDDPD
jgi:multicomponent Na+:H+ antiporter subunit C